MAKKKKNKKGQEKRAATVARQTESMSNIKWYLIYGGVILANMIYIMIFLQITAKFG